MVEREQKKKESERNAINDWQTISTIFEKYLLSSVSIVQNVSEGQQ